MKEVFFVVYVATCQLQYPSTGYSPSPSYLTAALLHMTSEPYWQPSQQEIDESALNKFRMYVNDRFKLRLQDYWSLWRWSTGTAQEMNDFWTALWDFTGVVGDKGPAPVRHRASAALKYGHSGVTMILHSSSMLVYQLTKLVSFVGMPMLIGQKTCFSVTKTLVPPRKWRL